MLEDVRWWSENENTVAVSSETEVLGEDQLRECP